MDEGQLFERLLTNEPTRSNMTQPSAGFINYLGLLAKQGQPESPSDIALTAAINKVTKEARERQAKDDAVRKNQPVELRKEYNRLRQELFGFQQWAKNAEIYCLQQADEVRALEARITTLCVQKKDAVTNPRLERNIEHAIVSAETELQDLKIEFNRAKHQSSNAARALKEFTGYDTIAALKKQLAA